MNARSTYAICMRLVCGCCVDSSHIWYRPPLLRCLVQIAGAIDEVAAAAAAMDKEAAVTATGAGATEEVQLQQRQLQEQLQQQEQTNARALRVVLLLAQQAKARLLADMGQRCNDIRGLREAAAATDGIGAIASAAAATTTTTTPTTPAAAAAWTAGSDD